MDDRLALIDECAHLARIQEQYTDAFGHNFVASAETRSGLLSGFGYPVETLAEAADSLHRLQQLRGALLAPLSTVQAGQAAQLKLHLDADAGHSAVCLITQEDGTTFERRLPVSENAVTLPPLPVGYHRVHMEVAGRTVETSVIAAPERCFEPASLSGDQREWGLSMQLYGLRSESNLGIGDYSDLASLVKHVAAVGGSFVGLNPVHALFPSDRSKYSPYSPSSRLFLESIYIDPQAIEGFSSSRAARLLEDPQLKSRIAALKAEPLVDYVAAWAIKRPILEALWLERRGAENPAFDQFRREQGERLTSHATFDALAEHFARLDMTWRGAWPQAYQRADTPEVAKFRSDHAERVAFYEWLQWLADDQLGRAALRARSAGMHVGLYRDLAVGSDSGGSEVWAHPDAYAPSLSIGAPPDPLAPQGQNWGLPALNPITLERSALAGFRLQVQANMRHAGALRIDHAFQLQRLFLVPGNQKPQFGAYVAYPFEAMLAMLRIESHRAGCIVIAEDLGTSPPNFSETIMRTGMYGYRVVPFERDGDGSFRRGSGYDARALAASGTHDLPTLVGWWRGIDIDLRNSLGIFDLETAAREHEQRRRELHQFCEALTAERLLGSPEPAHDAPLEAATAFLARTRCALVCVQIEDAIGEIHQANLPGVVDGHPNWRRRISQDLATIFAPGSTMNQLAALLALEGRDVRRRSAGLASPPPRATYRFQFRKEFGFDDAAALIPYLAELGISHVYASPIHTAQPGSSHGYDVADHATISAELGGEAAFIRLSDALLAQGMGLVLDIVPNHMGVGGSSNPSWLSVLEWGRESPAADMFDIDWEKIDAGGKLIVPFLGHRYGVTLERGELELKFDTVTGGFDVWHYDNRFPICPFDYPKILERALAATPAGATQARRALVAVSERLRTLATERTPEGISEAELLKVRLRVLTAQSPEVAAAVKSAIDLINGSKQQPNSFGVLHRLLEEQAYRLAHWRVASSDINYRRFFDINTLAGVRAEDPAVFDKTHASTLALVHEGRVQGLRIDHIDGLAYPEDYLRELQNAAGPAFYIIVEKILEPGEELRSWPVAGTSGYEVLNLLDGVFIDERSDAAFQRIYEKQLGEPVNYTRQLRAAKEEILSGAFSSELESLVGKLKIIAQANPMTRDFSRNALRQALIEMISFFPVYRTYATRQGASVEDLQLVEDTVGQIKKTRARTYPAVLDFITAVLTQSPSATGSQEGRLGQSFRQLFQQLTGPVMAKSLEDTLFYRYVRLLVLNEVGGDPHKFGGSVKDFHAANEERQRRWPHNMIATATHDTKRGEDARARLAALSEIPEEWEALTAQWHTLTQSYRAVGAPDSNDCYMFLQAILGAWPIELLAETQHPDTQAFIERLQEFATKALREAKRNTTWLDNDTRYEEGAHALIREALDPAGSFLKTARPFAQRLAHLGMLNALSRTAMKYTLPGVPDTFQGTEFWDLSLVDPDNRRPVDYAARKAALSATHDLAGLTHDWQSGELKQALTRRLLVDRTAEPEFYAEAGYRGVQSGGELERHVLAFERTFNGARLIVAVGRLFASLAEGMQMPIGKVWKDAWLPMEEGLWRDVVTGTEHQVHGGSAKVSELFSVLPLSVLRKVG